MDFTEELLTGGQVAYQQGAFYDTILHDLPSFLGRHADTLVNLTDNCPQCNQHSLMGIYEDDTDAVYDVMCTNCEYKEED